MNLLKYAKKLGIDVLTIKFKLNLKKPNRKPRKTESQPTISLKIDLKNINK